jgi:hypothetical protein
MAGALREDHAMRVSHPRGEARQGAAAPRSSDLAGEQALGGTKARRISIDIRALRRHLATWCLQGLGVHVAVAVHVKVVVVNVNVVGDELMTRRLDVRTDMSRSAPSSSAR